jgi:hypothetical protein
MSDPSPSSPIDIPGVAPALNASTLEVSKNLDPFETSLPEEDADELAWHKATLAAEEDIRERVTIPAEFPARHLWSPSSPPSDPSCLALGYDLAGHIMIPPVVLAQARAAVSNALSSSSQLSSVTPPSASAAEKKPLPEPVVTLFCPYDHTAGVIDTLVRRIATSEEADVLVLDSLMFAQGKDTSLGPGKCCSQLTDLHSRPAHQLPSLDFEKFLNTLFDIGKQNDPQFKSRQVQRYLRAMISVELPTSSGDGMTIGGASTRTTATELIQEPAASVGVPNGSALNDTNLGIKRPRSPANSVDRNSDAAAEELKGQSRSRIIYLKDVGAIASHAQSFLRELILAVRFRRTALQSNVDSVEPCDARKIQPTVIILGVSHSPERSPHRRSASCTWSLFVDGFKGTDYNSLCRLCPEIDEMHVPSNTESITDVLGDVLCATPDRVWYPDTTSNDPDMGHTAIYRKIIKVHGFFDSRDPPAKPKKSDKGERKPDQHLWAKGEAMAQKERKDEIAPLRAAQDARRFAANENLLRKALADCGGKIPEGLGIFSALPEGNLTTNHATGSNKSKKTEKRLQAEKYATLSGLKSNGLPWALANQIATLALYGLSSSKSVT